MTMRRFSFGVEVVVFPKGEAYGCNLYDHRNTEALYSPVLRRKQGRHFPILIFKN